MHSGGTDGSSDRYWRDRERNPGSFSSRDRFQPRDSHASDTDFNEAMLEENDALVERCREWEKRCAQLEVRLEDLRQAGEEQELRLQADAAEQLARVREEHEQQLVQAEARRVEAERGLKAEEEAKEQLQKQLARAQECLAQGKDEIQRVSGCLQLMEQRSKTAKAEVAQLRTSLQEAQSSLQFERLLRGQEQERCNRLEEELEDLRTESAREKASSRSGKRFVTNDLMSQMQLDLGDEDDTGEEEEANVSRETSLRSRADSRRTSLLEQRVRREASIDRARTEAADLRRECERLRRELAATSRSARELRAIVRAPWWSRVCCWAVKPDPEVYATPLRTTPVLATAVPAPQLAPRPAA